MLKIKNEEMKLKTDWDGSTKTITVRHPWLNTLADVANRVLSEHDTSGFLPEGKPNAFDLRDLLGKHELLAVKFGKDGNQLTNWVLIFRSREFEDLQCIVKTSSGYCGVPLSDILSIVESCVEYGVPGLCCPTCRARTLLSEKIRVRKPDGSISNFICPICGTLLDDRMRSVVCRGKEPVFIRKAA